MKMKCSVIQDLLPSYVDNICSEDTAGLVEEHVAECAQCKEKLEQMQNTEIMDGKASKKQVDYLKKVRSTISHKEELGKLILAILAGIAFVGLFVGVGGLLNYDMVPSVVFSVLLFCAALLAGNYRFSGGKAAVAEIGVSGAVFVFIVGFFTYAMDSFKEYALEDAGGQILFLFGKMEITQVGPLCVNILRAAAVAVVAVLLWNTFGKRKNAHATTLDITALCYIVYFNNWLYHMEDMQASVQYYKELTISQIVLALVGIIAFALLHRFGKAPVETGQEW